MKKFITYETENGDFHAMSEEEWEVASDDKKDLVELNEWLWQIAIDKETAIKYHVLNFDRFEAIENAGLGVVAFMCAAGPIPIGWYLNEEFNMILEEPDIGRDGHITSFNKLLLE